MSRMGRAGLLVATLLTLFGVLQPTGPGTDAPVVTTSVSTGHVWHDTLHSFQDQPRRLVADRHTSPAASDTWWGVYEPAAAGGPLQRRSGAGAADDAHVACAAPPPRSSRAPPEVS